LGVHRVGYNAGYVQLECATYIAHSRIHVPLL
jgi:hypothetical protein